jgi:heptosyltransferase-2
MGILSGSARLLARGSHDGKYHATSPDSIDRDSVKSLLVVRDDEIGDVVLTSGMLRELRRMYPRTTITLAVRKEVANIVEHCPYVDSVYLLEVGRRGLSRRLMAPVRLGLAARRDFAPQHFTLALQPRWDTDGSFGALVAFFSCARWRVSYSERVNERKRFFNRGFDRLYTHVIDDREPKHEVERNLDLLRFLGGAPADDSLELWLTSDDRDFALKARHDLCGDENTVLVAISPGAGHQRRMWPTEQFAEVAHWLMTTFDVRIFVVGGKADQQRGDLLVRQVGAGSINMAGRATLRQTAALLKECTLFVGNDSGPMHLAAASGVAVVEVSCQPRGMDDGDAQSPKRFGPWRTRHAIVQPAEPREDCTTHCRAKGPHCILNVTPSQVKGAILSLMPGIDKFPRA